MDNNNQNQNNQTVLPTVGGSDSAAAPPPPAADTPNVGWEPVDTNTNSSTSPAMNNQEMNSPAADSATQSPAPPVIPADSGNTTQLPQFGGDNANQNTDASAPIETQDTDPRPDWQKIDVSPHEVASPFTDSQSASSGQSSDVNNMTSSAEPMQHTSSTSEMSGLDSVSAQDNTSNPEQVLDQNQPTQDTNIPTSDFRKPIVEPVMDTPTAPTPPEPATIAEPLMDSNNSYAPQTTAKSLSTGTGLTPQGPAPTLNTDTITDNTSSTVNLNSTTEPNSPTTFDNSTAPDISLPGMDSDQTQTNSPQDSNVDSANNTSSMDTTSDMANLTSMATTDNMPTQNPEVNEEGVPQNKEEIVNPTQNISDNFNNTMPMESTPEITSPLSSTDATSPDTQTYSDTNADLNTQSQDPTQANNSQSINLMNEQVDLQPDNSTSTPPPDTNTMQTNTMEQQSPVEPPKPSGKKTGYIIAAVGLLLILAVGGIFSFTQLSGDSNPTPASQPALSTLPTNAPAVTPTTAPDPMASWQSYTMAEYSFRYPATFLLDTDSTDTNAVFVSSELPSLSLNLVLDSEGFGAENVEQVSEENIQVAGRSASKTVMRGTDDGTTTEYTYVVNLTPGDTGDMIFFSFDTEEIILAEANKLFEDILSTFEIDETSASPNSATDSATLN